LSHTHSPIVAISPITSSVTRVYSFEVEIPRGVAGPKTPSKILVHQTRAVETIRLIKKLGHLPEQIMEDVNRP